MTLQYIQKFSYCFVFPWFYLELDSFAIKLLPLVTIGLLNGFPVTYKCKCLYSCIFPFHSSPVNVNWMEALTSYQLHDICETFSLWIAVIHWCKYLLSYIVCLKNCRIKTFKHCRFYIREFEDKSSAYICDLGRECCGIFHYHWWTASVKLLNRGCYFAHTG